MGHHEQQLPVPILRRRPRGLTAAVDFLVCFFFVTLLVCSAWKCLWLLLDAAVFPYQTRPSAWTSLTVGAVVVYLQTLLRERLQRACFGGGRRRPALARLLLLLLWLGTVSLWRGIFLLMDTDSGVSWLSYGLFAAAGLLVLAKLRFLATALAPPLSVDVDLRSSFFRHESPLGSTLSDEYHLETMDAFLALVITCVATFLWRGVWGIMDKVLLPDQPTVSLVISLCLGFGLTSVSYLVQFRLVEWMCALSFGVALVIHDLLILVGFIGVVNVWRGVFVFFDTVLTLDLGDPVRLGAAGGVAGVSVLLLMMLHLSKNLLLCGVQRDIIGPLPFNSGDSTSMEEGEAAPP